MRRNFCRFKRAFQVGAIGYDMAGADSQNGAPQVSAATLRMGVWWMNSFSVDLGSVFKPRDSSNPVILRLDSIAKNPRAIAQTRNVCATSTGKNWSAGDLARGCVAQCLGLARGSSPAGRSKCRSIRNVVSPGRPPVYRYLSVTAPSEAVLTSLAYFASTPRVSFGGSGL